MALLIARAGGLGRALLATAVACATAVAPAPAAGQTFLTQDEALRLAFPDADSVVRRTAYLDEHQAAEVAALLERGAPADVRVVPYYLAVRHGHPSGVAYFDAHVVRTLPEVLMVVVGTDDRIRRIEVLTFSEPPDYRPPPAWLRQFDGRVLDDDLSLKGAVARMTGATLTAGAVTAAARRVLALHRIISPFGAAR